MPDEPALSAKTESEVAADAAWALVEAGMLARRPDVVRRIANTVRIHVDDLRRAKDRWDRGGRTRQPSVELRVKRDIPDEPSAGGSVDAVNARIRSAVMLGTGTPIPVAAKAVVDESAPEDLVAWLLERAPAMVAVEMRRIADPTATGRHHAVHKRSSAAHQFGVAAAMYEAGEVEALSDFRIIYAVEGKEITLGEMTGADHLSVSGGFKRMGVRSLMLAALHRHVAERIGDKRTDQVFTSAQYAQLFHSPAVEHPALELEAGPPT